MVEVDREVENESAQKRVKLTLSEEDDLNQKITKQIEYYFSDVNIIKDKFLRSEIEKDAGWVKLSVLATFKRLQNLTREEIRLVEALKEHKSEVIEFDASKRRVRRQNPLPGPDYQKELASRTVHISGFPTDYDFDSLKRFCGQFGEVDSLLMRRHFKTKYFKGCIHVTFKREEDAKKVHESDVLKCKDRELRRETMEAYKERKDKMKADRYARKKGISGDSKTDSRKAEPEEVKKTDQGECKPSVAEEKPKEDPKAEN